MDVLGYLPYKHRSLLAPFYKTAASNRYPLVIKPAQDIKHMATLFSVSVHDHSLLHNIAPLNYSHSYVPVNYVSATQQEHITENTLVLK